MFEDTVTTTPKAKFVRPKHDPCLYVCQTTGAVIVHHVDDIRGWEDVEEIGVSGSFLKRPKYRGDGFIDTTPNTKHVAKLVEL